MNCENCGGPMLVDADRGCLVCEYCKSEWIPQADDEGVSVLAEGSLECPLCKTVLFQASISRHTFLYCKKCRGMLIAMDEFLAMEEDLRAQRDAPAQILPPIDLSEADRIIQCPECHHDMDNHRYGGPGGVFIDTCEECGVHWLDRGEMHRIVVAPDPRPAILEVYERAG